MVFYLRVSRKKREETIVDFFIRFVSQIACVSHLVGLSHYFLLFFLFVLCLKSRVCPTRWVWALFFYVFYVSNASPTMWVWALFLFLFLCNCENLKILPFVGQNFGGVDWPPRPPSNTANMYRKISAVIMALQGVAGGRLLPQNFAWKKGEF